MGLISSALSALPMSLPPATPFYKIFMSQDDKPFGPDNDVTTMLQSRISSLNIVRRRSTSKTPTKLAEVTITIREPLDESFFSGLPGVGLDEGSKKLIRSARFGIKIGYSGMSPLDMIGTGKHYKQGKFLPKDQMPTTLGDTFLMRTTSMVFIGKLGMPTVTGSDKGEFSANIKLIDVMSTPSTLYDPLSKFSKISKLSAALQAEHKLGNPGKSKGKLTKVPVKTYTINPAIVPAGPATLGPLLMFKQIFKDLFQTERTVGDDTAKTFRLDTMALLEGKYLVHDIKYAMKKNSWTQAYNQNRYDFFKSVLDEYGVDFFLRYAEDGVTEVVLYPKGHESFVYLTPVDKDTGLGLPSPLPFAINAIYGLNVISFDFTPAEAGPITGGAQAVTLAAGEPGNTYKEEVVLTFSQDKMNAWVDKQKAANRAAGAGNDIDNITLINQQFLEMQAKAAQSAAGAEELYKAWYVKAEAVKDPASKMQVDTPGLGQKLKLKYRYALPGLVPGMFINFEGMESKTKAASLNDTKGFTPVPPPGKTAASAKKSNNIPDVIAGRYVVDEITYSFQPNATFTMEVTASR